MLPPQAGHSRRAGVSVRSRSGTRIWVRDMARLHLSAPKSQPYQTANFAILEKKHERGWRRRGMRGPVANFWVHGSLGIRAEVTPPVREASHDPQRHCRQAEASVQG